MVIEKADYFKQKQLANMEQAIMDSVEYTGGLIEYFDIVLTQEQKRTIYGRVVDKIENTYNCRIERDVAAMEQAIIQYCGNEQGFIEIMDAIPNDSRESIYSEFIDIYNVQLYSDAERWEIKAEIAKA